MSDAGLDGKLWPITLWLRTEDEERLERLAEKLDISGDEVVRKALEYYEMCYDAIEEYWKNERM